MAVEMKAVRFPPELWERLRRASFERGAEGLEETNISSLIRKYCEEGLGRHEARKRRKNQEAS